MNRTVQQGIEKFKSALRRHKRLLDEIRRRYNKNYGEGNWSMRPPKNFFSDECDEISLSETRLAAMSRALGLSRREWMLITQECGVDKDIDGAPANFYH